VRRGGRGVPARTRIAAGLARDHQCDAAEAGRTERNAAQKDLDGLGLGELRLTADPLAPLASAQECALLAEEFGRRPLAASFVGTALLAPEVLRMLAVAAEPPATHEGRPTVAVTGESAS
jgi:hypothetical protein